MKESLDDSLFTWSGEAVRDHGVIASKMPFMENRVTQISPGEVRYAGSIIACNQFTAGSTSPGGESAGFARIDQDKLYLMLPLSWHGDLKINGRLASKYEMHTTDSDGCIYAVGGERHSLFCGVDRMRLTTLLAALSGTLDAEPRDSLDIFKLSPLAYARCVGALSRILRAGLDSSGPIRGANLVHLEERVLEAMAEALLAAGEYTPARHARSSEYARIVRTCEDRFDAAQGMPVSLADLCAAAGVSKSTLYAAFHALYNLPPLTYIHLRRLGRARSTLLQSEAQRGAVKRAALDVGMTELGRFSVEYRNLFGESPSVSLHSAP